MAHDDARMRDDWPPRWLSVVLLLTLVPLAIVVLDVWAPPTPPPRPLPAPPATTTATTAAATGLRPRAYTEQALAIIEEHGVRDPRVRWSVIRQQTLDLVAGATTTADTYPAIQSAVAASGTRGALITPDEVPLFASDEIPAMPTSTRGSITTLGVPAFRTNAVAVLKTYAAHLAKAITIARPATTCGWVIDLRDTRGGDPWPMLAGLAALIPEGRLLSIVGADGATTPVSMHAGSVLIGTTPTVTPLGGPPIRLSQPIAILQSAVTAQAGEAVIVAFRHRARTFGRTTQGDVTAERTFDLPDGAVLVLTAWGIRSRTGERFSEGTVPDVVVPPDAAEAAARDWLASAC